MSSFTATRIVSALLWLSIKFYLSSPTLISLNPLQSALLGGRMKNKRSDVIIIGAGIAGLVTALELVKQGKQVLLLDAQDREKSGGLANIAFGGMALIDTPEQRAKKIHDSQEIAYQDWCRYAQFEEHDFWPKEWAKYYVENSITDVYEYVKGFGVNYLPAVSWAERGDKDIGNSVPRYHILWGCSQYLVTKIMQQLVSYEGSQLEFQFNTQINSLIYQDNRVVGCRSEQQEYLADAVVVATGGYGGDLNKVREYWPKHWKPLSQDILNGNDLSNDGLIHDQVQLIGGHLTHLDKMWNYAAGVENPKHEFDSQGLSLIPCRSALWVDHKGTRIGPEPLVGSFDTRDLCKQTNEREIPYSWQIMNRKIALKELAISGAEHNRSIRERSKFGLLKELLFGNKWLVDKMLSESDEFLCSETLDGLTEAMANQSKDSALDKKALLDSLNEYDLRLKSADSSDQQVKKILKVRQYLPDKLRTAKPASIIDKPPYIAIKLRLITRKSMGGIKTNLNCQVLTESDQTIDGLYAVGEAAGFGGGGASGIRSLEGTFLSGCIMTSRQLARSLV